MKQQDQQQHQMLGTEAMLARLREDKAQLDHKFAEALVHVRNLEAIIANQQAQHHALLQSRSWRLTSPLRALLTRGRQGVATARWVRQQARRLGGWGRLFYTVGHTITRHGVQGVWHKVRALHANTGPGHPGVGEQRSEYQCWIDRYQQLDPNRLATIDQELQSWASPPLLSILLPAYNTPEFCLRRAIDSVLAQGYPHWELCIANDASTDPHVATVMAEYAATDARIKVVHRPTNGHIAAASNSALELATGDFICLLDHDDVLAPHALYMVAKSIAAHPSADLFYSDEDKIDLAGQRFDPYFKPDWNPDLFLSYNFFNHFGIYRANLMRDLGGFRIGYEGSEDYDLVLRAIARVGHGKVHHIPHVLYHWGVIPGSAAASHNEKPYALKAAIRAVGEHLQGRQVQAQVDESMPGSGALRVRYGLPDPAPLVSIIIPTRDGLALLRQCIDSIFTKTTYPHFEIIVVDNGSTAPQVLDYLQTMEDTKRIRVLRDARPFNYSALNNAAAREAKGTLLCLMNNDIEVISPDWLEEMASQAIRPEIGMVGCRLWYPDDTLQHAGVILGMGGVAGHAHHRLTRAEGGYFSRAQLVQNYSAITAACAVVRAEVFWQVEGLNARDLAVAFNDIDLCLRIRDAGYRNLWTPFAELYHHESASRGHEDTPQKKARFAAEVGYMLHRYGDALQHDPAYNPNLALVLKDYTLAHPPRLDMLAVRPASQV